MKECELPKTHPFLYFITFLGKDRKVSPKPGKLKKTPCLIKCRCTLYCLFIVVDKCGANDICVKDGKVQAKTVDTEGLVQVGP